MIKYITSASIALILLSGLCSGDIFKHRQSGEISYGYPTNRTLGRKTQVYFEKDGKFMGKTVLIDEYDVTYDRKGRKDNIFVIGIDNQDIILSDTVCASLAKTITEGANKGPLYIILDIDSPGGRGDCMKKVCDAIKKTSNCPVIAFISGKKYGGAFSAAAGIALACDKIYIAPDALMGTVAPPTEATNGQVDLTEWQATFTPKSIGSFGAYLTTFSPKKNRPAAMVMAMVDQNIEVVEIVTDEQGSKSFVHKADKGSGAIVRTWSKMIETPSTESDSEKDDTEQETLYSITLSAKDAFGAMMVDAIIDSRSDVIEDLKADGAKVIVTSRIKSQVRKFAQSRAQIQRYYAGIEDLEIAVDEIEKQMKEVSSASLKNRPSREDETLKRLRREDYENKLTRGRRSNSRDRRIVRERTTDRRRKGGLSNEQINNLERDIQNTYVDPYLLQQQRLAMELASVLDELMVYYSRSVGIAKRYPGAMPKGKTLRSLQSKYNTAASKRNNLGY
jgi:membrane-bound ClpP family serine protease